MHHPFERLAPPLRHRLLAASFVATVIATAAIAYVDAQYRTEAARYGIVSLEVAGTPMLAQWILDRWSARPEMNLWVAFGIGADYLYLLVYGLFFSLATASVAARLAERGSSLVGVVRFVAFLQLLAPLCDAVENVGLFAMLLRRGELEFWAPFAAGFALAKFAMLGMGVTLLLLTAPLLRRGAAATPP